MDIGKEIRRLVNAQPDKYSAEGFAELLGYSSKQSYYDRTNANNFTTEELKLISRWLEVPLSHFIPEKLSDLSEGKTPNGKLYLERRVEILEYAVDGLKSQVKGLCSVLKTLENKVNLIAK